MTRRLEKAESRQRWHELRDLWNEFDPIGVFHSTGPGMEDWPKDEYESYVGPCMRLLEQNANGLELMDSVRAALSHMGMTGDDKKNQDFVKKMQTWFEKNWKETHV